MKDQAAYIGSVIRQYVDEENWQWLVAGASLVHSEKNAAALNNIFAAVPRKTGNKKIGKLEIPREALLAQPDQLDISDWTIDRVCRVWLIMQADSSDKSAYLRKTGNLFSGASMNELVALYSALPVLAYPEDWKMRCAEGIRSNIGTVLEAIMYENAYPYHFLEEAAFNQLVLKAFFTDKDIDRIVGMDQRSNPSLAAVLFDYARERWAAGRTVNPQLWRLTGKYINTENFSAIHRLWNTGREAEKKAALLACSRSDFGPARLLWENGGRLKADIENQKINWHNLDV